MRTKGGVLIVMLTLYGLILQVCGNPHMPLLIVSSVAAGLFISFSYTTIRSLFKEMDQMATKIRTDNLKYWAEWLYLSVNKTMLEKTLKHTALRIDAFTEKMVNQNAIFVGPDDEAA